ncbi:MAG: hypothetical protein ACRCZF_09810, partial [Gemmataceae bacterium]
DRERGLTGYCDYLITRGKQHYFVTAPVLVVIEAKREDLIAGLGQCAVAMVAAQRFNELDNTPQETIYGCVTSGSAWRFFALVGHDLRTDDREYTLTELRLILGILVNMTSTGTGDPACASAA